ncbi:MAG: ArsC/Spx/MgsR family protein [Flavobacteriaceae bacterium]
MNYKLYHNPRCQKSREAIEYLNFQKIKFEIVLYIKDGLSINILNKIIEKSGLKAIDLVRKQETVWKEKFKNINISEKKIIELIVKHPILLQRPIVVSEKKAIIARPVEEILKVLEK